MAAARPVARLEVDSPVCALSFDTSAGLTSRVRESSSDTAIECPPSEAEKPFGPTRFKDAASADARWQGLFGWFVIRGPVRYRGVTGGRGFAGSAGAIGPGGPLASRPDDDAAAIADREAAVALGEAGGQRPISRNG